MHRANAKFQGQSAWVALQGLPGIGNAGIRRLVDHYGSAEAVWEAPPAEWCRIPGLRVTHPEGLARGPDPKWVETAMKTLDRLGAWMMTYKDAAFPSLLQEISAPPALLYGLGAIEALSRPAVSIVGSRRATPYGVRAATHLAAGLARCGVVVVSGFAVGIDAAAHNGAMEAGGLTVAVLGCGLDILYPRLNAGLRAKVVRSGAMISEFPPGTRPEPQNFPIRNRIVSGLSLGIVVIEANMKSGSLITAAAALDQGREVMAVPGSIFSERNSGGHHLIKSGASMVEGVEDILAATGLEMAQTRATGALEPQAAPDNLDPDEKLLLDKMGPDPQHIDELTAVTGWPVSKTAGCLLELELKGLIQAVPGQMYLRG